jgi:K+-sensing histidine kinase KdpD
MTTEIRDQILATSKETTDFQIEADRWLEIFSIFVHDLESPLATVKYVLNQLEEGHLDLNVNRHKALVHSSSVAVKRAESILYDIMAVAKAGKVGIPVRLSSLDPQEIIREALVLAQGSADEHNVTLTCAESGAATLVAADPRLLTRMLDNLIYNGIRHTPAGGTITLYTEIQEHSVFVHVKDSGDGLGDIDPSKLFEKYGQLALRAEGQHRGVGLGLYFCKLAATGMGGAIMADDHPDGGAVFSIQLQMAECVR